MKHLCNTYDIVICYWVPSTWKKTTDILLPRSKKHGKYFSAKGLAPQNDSGNTGRILFYFFLLPFHNIYVSNNNFE